MLFVCTVCEFWTTGKVGRLQLSWASPPPPLTLLMTSPSTHQLSDVGGLGEGGCNKHNLLLFSEYLPLSHSHVNTKVIHYMVMHNMGCHLEQC